MGTLTAGQQVLPGYCEHKLPTSCRLTSIPNCCACADERAHAASYRTYIDGVGFVLRGTRWQRYCWFCKEFWENRVQASGLRSAQTRIPQVPDQTEFLERWYEFHRGYRTVRRDDGVEERIAVLGEDFRNVSPGHLPLTLEELRAGRQRDEAVEVQTPPMIEVDEPSQGPSLDDTLNQLYEAALEEGPGQTAANGTLATATHQSAQQHQDSANVHAQAIVPTGSRNRDYQARRVAALRRELHRMRGGIERVISGLRDLGEDVPDQNEATSRLTDLGRTLNNISETPSQQEAQRVLDSVNDLTQRVDSSQTNHTLANMQARVDEARRQVDEARRARDQTATELDAAEAEFRSSRQRLQQLQHEQRTTENYMRIFGTREEMAEQGESYVSPIGQMFNRADERFRAAEQLRREHGDFIYGFPGEARGGTGGSGWRSTDIWSVPVVNPQSPNVMWRQGRLVEESPPERHRLRNLTLESGEAHFASLTAQPHQSELELYGPIEDSPTALIHDRLAARNSSHARSHIRGNVVLDHNDNEEPHSHLQHADSRPDDVSAISTRTDERLFGELTHMTRYQQREDFKSLSMFVITALKDHIRQGNDIIPPLTETQAETIALNLELDRLEPMEAGLIDIWLEQKHLMWHLRVPEFQVRKLRLWGYREHSEIVPEHAWFHSVGLMALAYQVDDRVRAAAQQDIDRPGLLARLHSGERIAEDLDALEQMISRGHASTLVRSALLESTPDEWLRLDAHFLLSKFEADQRLRQHFDLDSIQVRAILDDLESEEQGKILCLPNETFEQLKRWVNNDELLWRTGLPSDWVKRRSEYVDCGGSSMLFDESGPGMENNEERDRVRRVNPILKIELARQAYTYSPDVRMRAIAVNSPARLQLLFRLQRGEMTEADKSVLTEVFDADSSLVIHTVKVEGLLEEHGPMQTLQGNIAAPVESLHNLPATPTSTDQSQARYGALQTAIAASRQAMQTGSRALYEQLVTADAETRAVYDRLEANAFADPSFPRNSARLYRPLSLGDFVRDDRIDVPSHDSDDSGAEDHAERGLDAAESGRPEPKEEEELQIMMDCKICYTQVADIACIPCGHLAMCQWCSDQHSPVLRHDRTRPARSAACPVCRKRIRNKYKVFRA